MPDAAEIVSAIQHAHFAWHCAPAAMQYHFEANILSWGFIHV